MENKPSNKIRVAVLFGGRSAEHEVSLRSAANVIQYLDASRFDVIPIGIDKQGVWSKSPDIFSKSLECKNVPKLKDASHAWFTPEWIGKDVLPQQTNEIVTKNQTGHHFDVVFPVVHGSYCEDGTLQGLLELAGLPYVGCGVLSSAIGMDKDVSKRLAMNAGIPIAPYLVVKQEQWQKRAAAVAKQVAEILSYPVFVKPANAGSSIGITKVKAPENLAAALTEAFQFDTKVVIEKGLNVLELELAVLESIEVDADPIVSVVGEIRPCHEFYSYDAKYLDENGAELLIPASVSDAIKKQAQVMAKTIFQVLECEGMARIDLFYDKDSQQLYFNEINTIPGFTQISMYPKLMEASGITYPELLTRLIQLALKRHDSKSQLQRCYISTT